MYLYDVHLFLHSRHYIDLLGFLQPNIFVKYNFSVFSYIKEMFVSFQAIVMFFAGVTLTSFATYNGFGPQFLKIASLMET